MKSICILQQKLYKAGSRGPITSLLSHETSPYFSWKEKSLLPKFLSQLEPLIISLDVDAFLNILSHLMTKPTKWHRVFAVCMKKAWVLSYPWAHRLGGCPGWSESSLGAQSFCWFYHVVAHIESCFFTWFLTDYRMYSKFIWLLKEKKKVWQVCRSDCLLSVLYSKGYLTLYDGGPPKAGHNWQDKFFGL